MPTVKSRKKVKRRRKLSRSLRANARSAMRLRPAPHSTYLFDRGRHPAPMLTANKPARQANYFQTGNVPQRCTAAAIGAPHVSIQHMCEFSFQAGNSRQQNREFRNRKARKLRQKEAGKRTSRAAPRAEKSRATQKTRDRARLRAARGPAERLRSE